MEDRNTLEECSGRKSSRDTDTPFRHAEEGKDVQMGRKLGGRQGTEGKGWRGMTLGSNGEARENYG